MTPIVVPHIIPYIKPAIRSSDYSSYDSSKALVVELRVAKNSLFTVADCKGVGPCSSNLNPGSCPHKP